MTVQQLMEKRAARINMPTQGAGSIEDALRMFLQAKTIATPGKKYLRSKHLSRRQFDKSVEELGRKTDRDDETFDLRSKVPNPKTQAALKGIVGALIGGGLGRLGSTGASQWDDILGGVSLGGAAGAGYGYLDAQNRRRNMLNTAKVLKDYGLLTPEKFTQAKPLLTAEL